MRRWLCWLLTVLCGHHFSRVRAIRQGVFYLKVPRWWHRHRRQFLVERIERFLDRQREDGSITLPEGARLVLLMLKDGAFHEESGRTLDSEKASRNSKGEMVVEKPLAVS